MNNWGKLSKWGLMLATLVVGLMTSACDSVIYDYEGDCGTYYRIKFKYDLNMKYADAFHQEVNSIALFVFDKNGTLVHMQQEDDKALLSSGDYSMPLELEPGEYDLLAWGGLQNEESFDLLANPQIGVTKIEDLEVKMHRKQNNGAAYVDEDLTRLFHGRHHLSYTTEPGHYTEVVSLTKNTNVIRVMLQQLAGSRLTADMFRFEITDDNGWMAYDNSLKTDEMITYMPWHTESGMASVESDIYDEEQVSVVLGEMTIARLMATKNPKLTIWNKESQEKVLSIPVKEYVLLVKGYYNRQMSDQEYLDRQDEYNITFFLENSEWLSASIMINSWRVVLNNGQI